MCRTTITFRVRIIICRNLVTMCHKVRWSGQPCKQVRAGRGGRSSGRPAAASRKIHAPFQVVAKASGFGRREVDTLLSGGESHQFCITGSRKCAKSAKWAIYLTVLVLSRLSIERILHISTSLRCRIGQIPVDTNIHTDREKIQEAN